MNEGTDLCRTCLQVEGNVPTSVGKNVEVRKGGVSTNGGPWETTSVSLEEWKRGLYRAGRV